MINAENIILSEDKLKGGGRLKRLASAYLRQKEIIKTPPSPQELPKDSNLVVTLGTTENDLGAILKASCRPADKNPNSPKAKVVLFQPTDPEDFLSFLGDRQDLVIPSTSLTAIEFAIQVFNQKIADIEAGLLPTEIRSTKLTYPNFLKSMASDQKLDTIQQQAEILQQNGFWSNEASFNRYQMRLSPDTCQITEADYQNLCGLSNSLYQENGILPGVARLLTNWQSGILRKSGNKLSPETLTALNYLAQLPVQNPDNYPTIVRLDLGRKITENGNRFYLFELEGTKTHAFGYVTIANQSFSEKFFRLLVERDWQNQPVFLVVGQAKNEEFYSVELAYFVRCLNQSFGTQLKLIDERESAQFLKTDKALLINLPQFQNQRLRQQILALYLQGKAEFLIPPNDAFGDKTTLCLLSNAKKEQALEAMLLQYIAPEALDTFRAFLPATLLMSKNNLREFTRDTNKYVLKLPASSGATGVLLPNSDEEYPEITDQLYKNFVIAQEYIDTTPIPYRWVSPAALGKINQTPMYERLELFCIAGFKLSMLTTANEIQTVHGGRNSIQIPVSIV